MAPSRTPGDLAREWMETLHGMDIRNDLPRSPRQVVSAHAMSEVNLVVIHCSGAYAGDQAASQRKYIASAAQYHIDKDWRSPDQIRRGVPPIHGDGLMYHLVVTRMGSTYWTRDLELSLWHAHEANDRSIAILLPGQFSQRPTEIQLAKLRRLLDLICHHSPEIPARQDDVWGHGDLVQLGNATACPGRGLQEWTAAYRGRFMV